MFRLRVNQRPDRNLFAQYPNDECWSLQIFTRSQTLHLNRSYLELESEYFRKCAEQCSRLDLRHVAEKPLLAVLKGLYGGELVVTSLPELEEIYQIVGFLQIQEYKANIQAELLSLKGQDNNQIFGSIELLEFSLNHRVLVKQITDFHFSTQLQSLESSRSYLSLIKLNEEYMNAILIGFHRKEGERSEKIISRILENYLNRKDIRPASYFMDESISLLRGIWEKYHHKLAVKGMTNSVPRLPNVQVRKSEIFSTGLIQTEKSPRSYRKEEDLDRRIDELMDILEKKNSKKERLKDELKRLKAQRINLSSEEDDQDETVTIAVRQSIRLKNQGYQLYEDDRSGKRTFLNKARNIPKKY